MYVLGWEALKSLGTPGHPQKASLTEKFPGLAGVIGTQTYPFPNDVWSFLTFCFFQFVQPCV